MRLGTAAQQVADMIEDCGVDAWVDGERFRAPGALVMLQSVEYDRIGGAAHTVTWTVVLVAGDHGPTEALDDLGDMLAKVEDRLGVERVEPVAYTSPAQGRAELPGLQFTLTTTVSDDETEE